MSIIKVSTADGETQKAFFVDSYSSLVAKIEGKLGFKPKEILVKNPDDRNARVDNEEVFETMLSKYDRELELIALRDGEKLEVLSSNKALEGCSTLEPGMYLKPGMFMQSANKHYKAVFNCKGNFALFFTFAGIQKSLWSTGNTGKSARKLVMQRDGNLAIYNKNGKALWASGTHGNGLSRATLRDDGNFVIYDANGKATWSTETGHLYPYYNISSSEATKLETLCEDSLVDTKLRKAEIFQMSHSYEKAAREYMKALKLLRYTNKAQSSQPLIASTLFKLTLVLAGLGKPNESGETLKESIVIRKRIRKDSIPNISVLLEKLKGHLAKQLDPSGPVSKRLIESYELSSSRDFGKIEETLKKNFQSCNDKPNNLEKAAVLCRLTHVYLQHDQFRQAVETFQDCLEISRMIPIDAENMLIALSIMAHLFAKYDDWNQAIKFQEELLELRRELYVSQPTHPDIVASLDELTEAHEQLGNLDEAIKYTKEAYNLKRNSKDPFNLDFAECLIKLIDLHRKSNHPDNITRLSQDLLHLSQDFFEKQTCRRELDEIVSNLIHSLSAKAEYDIPFDIVSKSLELVNKVKYDESNPKILEKESNIAHKTTSLDWDRYMNEKGYLNLWELYYNDANFKHLQTLPEDLPPVAPKAPDNSSRNLKKHKRADGS